MASDKGVRDNKQEFIVKCGKIIRLAENDENGHTAGVWLVIYLNDDTEVWIDYLKLVEGAADDNYSQPDTAICPRLY